MTPERQKKIDKIKHGSEIGIGISFALVAVLGLIPDIWGIHIPKFAMSVVLTCFFLSFALLIVSSFWASDEEKEQRKAEIKEAMQEIESEKKTKTKTTYDGKSPLVDLDPKQVAVVHKFLCDIPSQGDHIKTAELKHILHVLEERGDIDMSNREQVLAWVESITKRPVESNKFWNEYDWRRSKDREKHWSKKIITEFDKLR